MVCKYCGSEVAEDAKFCPNCGRPVDESAQNVDNTDYINTDNTYDVPVDTGTVPVQAVPSTGTNNSKIIIAVIAAVIFVVAAILLIVFVVPGLKSNSKVPEVVNGLETDVQKVREIEDQCREILKKDDTFEDYMLDNNPKRHTKCVLHNLYYVKADKEEDDKLVAVFVNQMQDMITDQNRNEKHWVTHKDYNFISIEFKPYDADTDIDDFDEDDVDIDNSKELDDLTKVKSDEGEKYEINL